MAVVLLLDGYGSDCTETDCNDVSDSRDSILALASHQMCSWIAFKGSQLCLELIGWFISLDVISFVKRVGRLSTQAAAAFL